jgi:hypothetical protein
VSTSATSSATRPRSRSTCADRTTRERRRTPAQGSHLQPNVIDLGSLPAWPMDPRSRSR